MWVMMPYVALACAYCADAWRDSRWSNLLKPLLMPALLMGYAVLAHPVEPLIALGIAMGFAGDVALMLPADKYGDGPLLAGVGAFLLGHVMYLIWFVMRMDGMFSWWTLAYLPPVVYIGLKLYRHLRSGLGDMKPAVIAYETVILLMSVCAFALMLARFGSAALLIWLGSVSFIVSDSVLAEGMFIARRAHSHFIVMSTYTLAQLLIALGAVLL